MQALLELQTEMFEDKELPQFLAQPSVFGPKPNCGNLVLANLFTGQEVISKNRVDVSVSGAVPVKRICPDLCIWQF